MSLTGTNEVLLAFSNLRVGTASQAERQTKQLCSSAFQGRFFKCAQNSSLADETAKLRQGYKLCCNREVGSAPAAEREGEGYCKDACNVEMDGASTGLCVDRQQLLGHSDG